MPSNYVLANNNIEYIVVDSKMDEFLHWLNENGQRVNTGKREEPDEIIQRVASNTPTES